MRRWLLVVALAAVLATWTRAQDGATRPQTQEDDYTRYELLAPDTAQFRILYEVTATAPGARFFFNTIRKGSIASDERVIDSATGQALEWQVVGGAEARKDGHPAADLDTDYIKVRLARPVPQHGQVRVLIDKTYKDPQSYKRDGDTIVFDRSLGIRRNAVVLPAGYALVSCNVPSQVLATPDGRVMVSFLNPGPSAAPLLIRARPGLAPFTPTASNARGPQVSTSLAPEASRLRERAHDDREIEYDLQDPATHAFSLFHDYTESRPGTDRYLNVVRQGSTVSKPSAMNLDTGTPLKHEILKGPAIRARGLDIGEAVRDDSEVVAVWFDAVKPGQSVRLRISETYADPARYRLEGDELVWDRSFGRPRNVVVLPAGWTVVGSAVPMTATTGPDGRQRLLFENPRPDELQVLVRARRLRQQHQQ